MPGAAAALKLAITAAATRAKNHTQRPMPTMLFFHFRKAGGSSIAGALRARGCAPRVEEWTPVKERGQGARTFSLTNFREPIARLLSARGAGAEDESPPTERGRERLPWSLVSGDAAGRHVDVDIPRRVEPPGRAGSATWIFREDESRRRRGHDVDIP